MNIEPWIAATCLVVLLGGGLCWWIGLRWRSFLLLGVGIVLGALVGRGVAALRITRDPGWWGEFMDGLRVYGAVSTGAWLGGGVSLLGLIAFHVLRRRRQNRCVGALVRRADGAAEERMHVRVHPDEDVAVLEADHLEAAMADLEECVHVKYVPCPESKPLAYEDWAEVVADRASAADACLLVPHRTRVRFRSGALASPRLANPFDCIVISRESGGSSFRASPASRSPFCERAMALLHAANSA